MAKRPAKRITIPAPRYAALLAVARAAERLVEMHGDYLGLDRLEAEKLDRALARLRRVSGRKP